MAITPTEVNEDLDLAVRYSVRRTPTLFVNGLRLEGVVQANVLRTIIESERRTQLSALALGVEHRALYATRVASTFVDLGTDPPVRGCVPIGKAPTRGASEAPINIVVFSEFQCRYCGSLRVTYDALLKSFGQKVRIAWKNFPLEDHREARAAANLAMHATNEADVNAFWKVHDALFDSQSSLGTATYGRIADELGFDRSVYLAKVEAREYDVEIDRDIELGQQLGVTSVPTSFINGRRVEGAIDALTLAGWIAEELENMKRFEKAGYEPHRLSEVLCQPR
jgi:protein-disulfide isomerase